MLYVLRVLCIEQACTTIDIMLKKFEAFEDVVLSENIANWLDRHSYIKKQ